MISIIFRSVFRQDKWIARGLDFLVVLLVGIWFLGGVEWNSHLYLKHGADLRRAAFGIGIAIYFLAPGINKESLILQGAKTFFQLLMLPVFRWGFYGVWVMGAVVLAVHQTKAFRVTLYDVGIFHQILWSLSNGEGFHSTISKAGNFLQDHLSPSLAILVPFFKLFGQSPFFLPVVHVLLIYGGAAAWIWLAERISEGDFRNRLAAATLLFIVSFESLWANLTWGFHENALGFFGLSWGLALLWVTYFKKEEEVSEKVLETGRAKKILALILFLFAAFSKEILLIDVAFVLILWAIFEIRGFSLISKELRRLLFPVILVFLALALVRLFFQFESLEHPADKNYFNRYYAYLGHDLSGFFQNLFRFPELIAKNVGLSVLLNYGVAVFLPWLFLPIFWPTFRRMGGATFGFRNELPDKRCYWWLFAILPSFASAALSTFAPLRSVRFHYVLELWPLLACMTIGILAALRKNEWLWVWVVLSILRWDHDSVGDFRVYRTQSQQQETTRRVLERIPLEASVMADELAGTWVAGRKWVVRWPDSNLLPGGCADYWVLQGREMDLALVRDRVLKTFPSCFSKAQSSLSLIHYSTEWLVFKTSNPTEQHNQFQTVNDFFRVFYSFIPAQLFSVALPRNFQSHP